MYAGLLNCAAADLLSGGPVAGVLDGHLDDPGRSALALRMMGGVHALVLSGLAPGLAAFYPSAGGRADAGLDGALAWPALREVLSGQRDAVREWLASPPQTNEVGRGAALAGGLCTLVAEAAMPVRLTEIGASAGLNLRADLFRIEGDQVCYGDRRSPVQLAAAWRGGQVLLGGRVPGGGGPLARGRRPAVRELVPVQVTERTGGDVSPVDPASEAGQIRLAAYVWPDQAARLARLRGAIELAARIPADLRRETASVTIARTTLQSGAWTVLWHSVMRQYLDPDEKQAVADGIAALGAAATSSARFGHLRLEPGSGSERWPVTLTTWPGGRERVLGTAQPHGIPVSWAGPG